MSVAPVVWTEEMKVKIFKGRVSDKKCMQSSDVSRTKESKAEKENRIV